MNKTVVTLVLIFIVILIGINSQKLNSEDTVKIGVLSPVGGAYASIGEFALNGYMLAVDEINSRGGVNGKDIELIVETHDGEDVSGVVNAYLNLKSRGINLILGPVQTNTGLAVAPVACKDNVIVVAPSIGGSEFTKTCKNTFSTWPVDRKNSTTLGTRVVEEGNERIAIIGSVQSWEKEQADAVIDGVESKSGNIVHVEITNNKPENYITESTKIMSSGPDAIVFTNYGYMHVVAKKLRDLGSDAQFYSVLLTDNHREKAEGAFEGTVVISANTTEQWFKDKYELHYNHLIGFPADSAYDSVMILAQAIKETGGTDYNLLSEYILRMSNYEGASGIFSFTDTGDVIKDPVYQMVVDNEIVEI